MSLTLPIAMGEDVSGKIIIRDLASMPHLLIAGSTGSGKSMLINSVIMGLLYRHSPDTLKFILVDPKHVELSVYNGIPHLLTPVITDMENVNNALKWAVKEMDTRYQLLKEDGARNIAGYNANKEREGKLSNIVVIIDEMADLMLTKGIEVENSIVRLAQMARAVGIHLVLATQRPSVNVITGIIKANIPARIALSVASVIDSRVILDQLGAETLLGRGDMLFKSPDMGKTIRVQGALVTEEEISRVIKFISEQGTAEYNESVLTPQRDSNSFVSENGSVLSEDNLFPDAVRIVVAAGPEDTSTTFDVIPKLASVLSIISEFFFISEGLILLTLFISLRNSIGGSCQLSKCGFIASDSVAGTADLTSGFFCNIKSPPII